jgi:hypothetical protein
MEYKCFKRYIARNPRVLNDYSYQVFSQNGQNGQNAGQSGAVLSDQDSIPPGSVSVSRQFRHLERNSPYRAPVGNSKQVVWLGSLLQSNNPFAGGARHGGNRAVTAVAAFSSR